MVEGLVLHPSMWLSDSRKFFYLFVLMAPLASMSLSSPLTIVPSLPLMCIPLLSSQPMHWNLHNHYALGILPFLFLAALNTLKRRFEGFDRLSTTVMIMLLLS